MLHSINYCMCVFLKFICIYFFQYQRAMCQKTLNWVNHVYLPSQNKEHCIVLYCIDTCSPTWETHMPSDMSSLPEKQISLVICVPLLGKHISLIICVPLPGKHIALVKCVPLPWKHISLLICVRLPGKLGNTYPL